MRRFLAATMLLLVAALPVRAIQPDEVLPDPAQEARARMLGKELRCLVCQNQSIDDSEADLARDLRILVRQRIEAGDSDADVLRYVHARYGDFVLLRPPVNPSTWLLWFGPFVLLAGGAAGLWLQAHRRRAPAAAPLGPDERARLDALLHEGDS